MASHFTSPAVALAALSIHHVFQPGWIEVTETSTHLQGRVILRDGETLKRAEELVSL